MISDEATHTSSLKTAQGIRRPRLVSFSGIDGAGKSTQIANLTAWLTEQGLSVSTITFWDDVAMLKPLREGAGHKLFKGDAGVGSPEKPIERRDKNIQSPLMSIVRLILYALDALSLRRAVKHALASHRNVVIFDRFLYDELANLNLSNALMRLYARVLVKVVPRPHVAFILDADPEAARARKPEYPLAFLRTNRESYLALSRLVRGMVVIAPMPIEQAKDAVLKRYAESHLA